MVSRAPVPAEVAEAVAAVSDWLRDDTASTPERAVLARAVRLTARALAAAVPGSSVEVRIPPFAAVQCISGPRHTRGTPPNVVEADARTWLLLAVGLCRLDVAVSEGLVSVSGSRAAEIESRLPVAGLPGLDATTTER